MVRKALVMVGLGLASFAGCGGSADDEASGGSGGASTGGVNSGGSSTNGGTGGTSGAAGTGGNARGGEAGGSIAEGGAGGSGAGGSGAGGSGAGGSGAGGSDTGGSDADGGGHETGGASGSSGSGSVTGGAGSGGGQAGGSAGNGGGAGDDCFPELMLVLDRSASMNDPPTGATQTKWQLVVPALDRALTATAGEVGWGLKAFPEGQDTGSCAAESITNTIHVPLVAGATTMSTAIHALTPEGDSTPTGDAVKTASAYFLTRTTHRPRYIVLVTDGDPSCPSGGNAALIYAVNEIAAAAAAGIHTFVVGVDTSKESSVERLNLMAIAGLEPRTDPNPLAPRFYLASTVDALSEALVTISRAAACP